MQNTIAEYHQWVEKSAQYIDPVHNILRRAEDSCAIGQLSVSDLADSIARSLALSVFQTIPDVVSKELDRHRISGEFAELVLAVEAGGDEISAMFVKALRKDVRRELERLPKTVR